MAAKLGNWPRAASIEIGLNAAIVSVDETKPQILIAAPERDDSDGRGDRLWGGLPFGPFTPLNHRTLEIGLRTWVKEQTGLDLGYVEQLYTFGDRGRHANIDDIAPHSVSIGYLALTRHMETEIPARRGHWQNWYAHFPWEDWRNDKPVILEAEIEPRLEIWAGEASRGARLIHNITAKDRVRVCFGLDGVAWDEEKVLERYELLYEAGLVGESARDGARSAGQWPDLPQFGRPMRADHRRILATAMGRFRGKIKYRPVVFELMPLDFTLFELQQTVEAILGSHLHKQNFRRIVEKSGLVEPTGGLKTHTGGRPAQLFRFRHEVLLERPAPGVRIRPGRS